MADPRAETVADVVGPGLKLLFVGINPGLRSAAMRSHFAHPANRFYPALFEAGIIEHRVDRKLGLTPDERSDFIDRGLGITNIVRRATARASEVAAAELRAGGEALRRFVRERGPAVVAIAGITAYRTAFSRPKAAMGEQAHGFEGARLFVVPNPSGLNAHETIATLAVAYREAAVAAGVIPLR